MDKNTPYLGTKMRCTPWMLTTSSLTYTAVAIGALALAVSTDHWIILKETGKYPSDINATEFCSFNITSNLGLWRYCTIAEPPQCLQLEYEIMDNQLPSASIAEPPQCLPLEYEIMVNIERMDNQLTSASIAEAQMGATPFFLASLLLVVGSGIMCIIGNLQGNGKTLIAAIFSITAGLAMGVGIIFYITFINDEVSHAKNNPSSDNFFESYRYGWSFYLVGLSFLASELAAVVCVTLYLKRNAKREDLVRIIPGLEEKFKSDEPRQGVTNYSTLIL